MTREWSQKHIEELIKRWWDEHKGELPGGGGFDPENPVLPFNTYLMSTSGASHFAIWQTLSVGGNITLYSDMANDKGGVISKPYLQHRLTIAQYVTSGDIIDGNGICYLPATGSDCLLHAQDNLIKVEGGKAVSDNSGTIYKNWTVLLNTAFNGSGRVIIGTREYPCSLSLDQNATPTFTGAGGTSVRANSKACYLLRISDPSLLVGQISPVIEWQSAELESHPVPVWM